MPQGSLADVTIPVDFKLQVPAILTEQLSATAQVKFDGSTILIIVTVALLGLFVVIVDRILFTIFIH